MSLLPALDGMFIVRKRIGRSQARNFNFELVIQKSSSDVRFRRRCIFSGKVALRLWSMYGHNENNRVLTNTRQNIRVGRWGLVFHLFAAPQMVVVVGAPRLFFFGWLHSRKNATTTSTFVKNLKRLEKKLWMKVQLVIGKTMTGSSFASSVL